MTTQRWLFVIVSILLAAGTAFGIYFREIQMPKWSADREAEELAIEAGNLAEVEEVYHHIWDKESWIVKGLDQEGRQVFVWLADDEQPEIIHASDGFAQKKLKDAFEISKPQANIKRIQPGLLQNTRVWEIFYSVEGSPDRYYYEFYRFDNGQFLEEYKLPAGTEP
ncbi:DUF5590 domain-containing protein [Paenibacillus harenae]|uniref:cell wall elongation regulator TseB-like domain-containing protein n=1 Tax=Paenibacillus harenae TaxID=306543 RepID=UPI001B7FE18C|nr:DUF5590 domain-containing protein [Paenibacillus harenae]